MTTGPYVSQKLPQYVEGVVVQVLRELITNNPALPDKLFLTENNKPVFPTNQSGEISLPVYAGWPETVTRIPSIIVVATPQEIHYSGIQAEDYHYSHDDTHDSFAQFYYETGVITITINARTFETMHRLQGIIGFLIMYPEFRRRLAQHGISIRTALFRWSTPTRREYSTLKYFISSVNVDYRTEAVVGKTVVDEYVKIEETESNSERIE